MGQSLAARRISRTCVLRTSSEKLLRRGLRAQQYKERESGADQPVGSLGEQVAFGEKRVDDRIENRDEEQHQQRIEHSHVVWLDLCVPKST